jgi:hypothetical protein
MIIGVDREGDHVDADLDELIKGFPVEVSDRPVHGGAERDVHAGAAAEGAARNDFGRNVLALHPLHCEHNRAANHDLVTDVTVVDKVCVVDRNLLGGTVARSRNQGHRVVDREFDALSRETACARLRAGKVDHRADIEAEPFGDITDALMAFERLVKRRVRQRDAGNIHACLHHCNERCLVCRCRPDGCDDLRATCHARTIPAEAQPQAVPR